MTLNDLTAEEKSSWKRSLPASADFRRRQITYARIITIRITIRETAPVPADTVCGTAFLRKRECNKNINFRDLVRSERENQASAAAAAEASCYLPVVSV